jgi:cell division protein FtsB
MTAGQDMNSDALANAVLDIGRHIAGLADELQHLRHPVGSVNQALVHAQINKLKDQAALLTAVIADLARAASEGAS